MTDNQAASLLGTYGNPDIRTPHIDELAESGIQFSNAYAVNGMCSPTRATLMTGLMPSQHGVHNWLDDSMLADWPQDWSAVAEFRTLPYTLNSHGYATAMIGKWHLGQPWEPSIGYEHWVTFPRGDTRDFWHNEVVENGEIYEVNDKHLVEFFADKAVEFIAAYDDSRPFYLQLNLNGPYVNPPTNLGPAKNRFYKEYEEAPLDSFPREPIHPTITEMQEKYSKAGHEAAVAYIEAIVFMNGDQETRANIASQNALVDEQVGRVLAALEQAGFVENTLVLFSSDQGNFYGQHGLWTHTIVTEPGSSPYEVAMNIPLIFSQPGRIAPNQESDFLIGQYDIPATILEYVGIEDVEFTGSPGESFKDMMIGQAPRQSQGERTVFFEQEETRGLRTPGFAYWKRIEGLGEPVLFNMKNDFNQDDNLADDPAYADIIAELDQRLDDFFSKYADAHYDLWEGGVAKGSVARPHVFQQLYGPDWAPEAEVKPKFE